MTYVSCADEKTIEHVVMSPVDGMFREHIRWKYMLGLMKKQIGDVI